jgi:RNA polymerase sigma-70 factor (ECF subfamily)
MNDLIIDKALLSQAFLDWHEDIYSYVYYRCGRRQQVAEDIAQEAFLRAWKHRESFDDNRASLKTWIYTIARNLVIDEYKKNSHKFEVNGEQDLEQPDTEASDPDAPIMLNFVLNKINQLNSEEQELLTLRFINECELEEISKIINKNYNSTKVAVHRALQKLKLLIDKQS